jgi:hypothetical protein
LPALGPGARACSIPIVLGPGSTSVDVSVDGLPPNLALGPIGTIYVDNTMSAQTALITFPDTLAVNEIPAGSAPYILAVTGGKRFNISSPVLVPTQINLQILNLYVSPTGVQPVTGAIVVTAGSIAVSNPGPISGPTVSRSQVMVAGASTTLCPVNPLRKFLLFQMPQNSDGWVTFNGGGAAPVGVDAFYLAAGEKYLSTGFVPSGAVNIVLTNTGMVPALEG